MSPEKSKKQATAAPLRPLAGARSGSSTIARFDASAVLLSLLSGILTAFCYPRPGLCFLAWFSLAPLLSALSSGGVVRGFGLAWLAGTAFHGTLLYWIYNTTRFAGLPVWVGILAWVSLATFLGLAWGLIGALGRRFIPDGSPVSPWAWAALWTACAAVTSWWTPRLGVDLLAYTQYRNLSLIQIGSFAGPHALGFLIVLFNAALVEAWAEVRIGGESPASPQENASWGRANFTWALVLIGLVWVYGKAELTRRGWAEVGSEGTARVEILQPNIDQYQKWDDEFSTKIMANFEELLARPRSRPPDLVLWPESAIPWIVQDSDDLGPVSAWSRRLGAAQLVGVVSRDAGGQKNSAYLIGPGGGLVGTYHKRELVPFGEYVPFKWLGRYIKILTFLDGTVAGEPDQEFFETPVGLAAGSICYEAMFPRWARRDAARGARVILNITNDGWYKNTWGPNQHFYANVYRAVENRVTVIRAGNTGISGVIDPWGVVTAKLGLNQRGRLEVDVPLKDNFPRGSFYSRHGDWFGLLCVLAALAMIFAGWRRSEA